MPSSDLAFYELYADRLDRQPTVTAIAPTIGEGKLITAPDQKLATTQPTSVLVDAKSSDAARFYVYNFDQ